ncbi:MAG: cupin domain-containing protein [Mariniphaga sp.]|jgi:quercetin dioxygenase-like cupin family protein|nr:cupin domain-containing protein [Mariniphaga sp.]
MFTKKNTYNSHQLLKGVEMRPLAFGKKTNLCEFHLSKGERLPSHSHPYEQTGTLVNGKLNFRIENTWFLAEPGDAWNIPENVEHEVEILEDSVVLETFSPVRPDYLPE